MKAETRATDNKPDIHLVRLNNTAWKRF